MVGDLPYDVDELVEPFMKPCLVLTGRQDCEVEIQDQFQLLKLYPMGSYLALNCAGHNLQIEQREVFQAIVGNWIRDHYYK